MLAFMKLAVGMRGFFDACRSRRHAETDCSDDLALSAQCVLDSRFHLHSSPASDKNESVRVVHLSEETHHRFSVKCASSSCRFEHLCKLIVFRRAAAVT